MQMLKTYHGSCNCKTVTFKFQILPRALENGTSHYAQKSRFAAVGIKPTDFRLLTGADSPTLYNKGPNNIENAFCKKCSVYSY